MKPFACLSFVLLVSACKGGGLGIGTGDSSCTAYKDRASCEAVNGCVAVGCPTCHGPGFSGCYDAHDAPMPSCTSPLCPASCSQYTDATSCAAAGCEAGTCPDCQGGTVFGGCYQPGQAGDIACPALCTEPACAQITDEGTCESTTGCHAVYVDHQTCACTAPGCCTTFDHCASGLAACTTSGLPPQCNKLPVCEGEWKVDYNSGPCPTGCVREAACNDCRSTGCATGTCQQCWATWECMTGENNC